MKKIIVTAFLVLGAAFAFAQTENHTMATSGYSVTENQLRMQLRYSPADNTLEITAESGMSQDNVSIEVLNLLGQKFTTVYTGPLQKGRKVFTLNTASMQNGIYLVRFTNGKTGVARKMVIQRG